MSKNNTQRPSPSSPQEQAEPRLEAGEGLDGTACSASSFIGKGSVGYDVQKESQSVATTKPSLGFLERLGINPLERVAPIRTEEAYLKVRNIHPSNQETWTP